MKTSGLPGLRGFANLRTRENTPVDPALLPPERHCRICGCVLRRSNITDTCAPCTGVVDIPDWAECLIEFDDQPSTINTIAQHLRCANGFGRSDTKARNRYICEQRQAGVSEYVLAAAFGLGRTTIQKICEREGKRDV
jgi:hypothetical protein